MGARTPFFAKSPEMRQAIAICTRPLIGVAIGTAVINALMLTGPLFMLQVYDRVLPSRSVPTLVGLFLLALFLFAFQCFFDVQRGRILLQLGRLFDELIGPRIFGCLQRSHEPAARDIDNTQIIRDVDSVRGFISGAAMTAIFDLPWMFVYVGVCFLFHPWMGITVFIATLVLGSLTVLSEYALRDRTATMTTAANKRRLFADLVRRSAGTMHALGLKKVMAERWEVENAVALDTHVDTAEIGLAFSAALRTLRTLLQSGLLGLGAYLVINQQATAGVMLAASIIAVRALAPLDVLIANWKNVLAARQSWTRLDESLVRLTGTRTPVSLPAPKSKLQITALGLAAPDTGQFILHGVTFAVAGGSALGVVGPSGSGKTSLARALTGIWPTAQGTIRIDGAKLADWPTDDLCRQIGYLPQDVELFPGTVAQNIARFQPDVDSITLLQAAQAAGVHDMILQLPQAYDTQVGEGGAKLSGGQRQRIGLARALFANPFIVVLDEPNSNLDAQGEAALTNAIRDIRTRGGIAIVIAHRSSALAAVDKVLVLNDGRVKAFGDRDTIFPHLVPRPVPALPTETEETPASVPKRASRVREERRS